jgi:hypothetical protein
VPMLDDGQHDDGAAGDGVFGAALPLPTGARQLRLYVEAALPSGRAACAPASGGAGPKFVALPDGKDGAAADGATSGADADGAKGDGAKGKSGHKKKRQD